MAEQASYLCEACPGKGDFRVDFDVNGSCVFYTADSFKQARRFWLHDPNNFGSDINELASNIAGGLIYYDEEIDDNYFRQGDYATAKLGGLCAQQFLDGGCSKSLSQILIESDTD